MLRPRESNQVRLTYSSVVTEPAAKITWATDVFGNEVATAVFSTPSNRLVVDSVSKLELHAVAWPIFDIFAGAAAYPFSYSDADLVDLGALTKPQYPDPNGQLLTWARRFVLSRNTDTLSLLKDLSSGVHASVSYQSREAEGTQSPVETLNRGWGSCRDFAVLFVEAARSLGFGARIVSGYLNVGNSSLRGSSDSGSTHAWAEIYLPGAGWITFDPTNRSMGGLNLIPVAVARDLWQTTPILGSFVGAGAFLGMDVEVSVTG
jgi:transglutaminase-like putative cysteine protease